MSVDSPPAIRRPGSAGLIQGQAPSESDAEARISSESFLPIHVLPGLLDENAARDAQVGAMKPRARERAAYALAARIASFPGRLIVAIGAYSSKDLERL